MRRFFVCRRAFTLVELLLVMAIIAIVTAVTIPSFVNSMKGSRLRTAVRTVVKTGRYARSIAVLKQVPVTVSFNLDTMVISVDAGSEKDSISRALEGVRIASLETVGGEKSTEGVYMVVYQANGRCMPYTVTIADQDGVLSKVMVDALASVVTEAHDE